MKIFLRNLLLVITFIISNAVMAQKLYWVGGSGQFNDPAHWSFTSNGLGGAKTPTLTDDVYFDENSFKSNSVISIIGGANCRNLIFADNTAPVTLSGTQNEKLTIAGDAKFNTHLDNQFLGNIYLTSIQNNTSILFGVSEIKGNLFFDGTGTLEVKTIVASNNSSININSGKIKLSDASIFAGSIIVGNNGSIEAFNAVLSAKNKLLFNNHAKLINNGVYIEAPITNSSNYNLGNNQVPQNRIINNDNSTLSCTFTSTIVSQPKCANSCDGVVIFNIPAGCSGAGPYTATWLVACGAPAGTPGTNLTAGTYTQSNVCGCSGAYTIVFANNAGNFAGSVNFSITDPASIQPFFSNKQPSCNGACDGKVFATIIGGTQPYKIKWNPGPTHINNPGIDSITGLCAGTYSVLIIDNNNCKDSTVTPLAQPPILVANGHTSPPTCFGLCNGKVWVAPSGGTSYTLTQSNGIHYTTVWDGNSALNNDTLQNLPSPALCAGTTHTCVVTDTNGCAATYIVTIPAAPNAITFTQTNNSPLNCQNVCNGILSVNTVAGGTIPYTFTWAPSVPSATTATSSTASNLCAGNYTCTITDAHTCTTTATYTIIAPQAITHTLTVINPKCNGQNSGSIKDSVGGGTLPYTSFAWSVPLGTITNTPKSSTDANLGPGTYSVVLTDNKGCKDTARATLTNPPVLTATTATVNPTCFGVNNGQICVTAAGGTGAVYTYSWNPVEP
ncbi:MAG: SprB repeat-containing protein, partial [Bacteroidia bacterium]